MLRRLLPALLACLAAVPLVQSVAPSTAAAADNGLRVRSTTTYTIDPNAGVVDVVVELTLTNTVPDERTPGGVRRFFFSGFSLPAPAGALGAVATADGRVVDATPRFLAGNDDYYLLDVDFGRNLFFGESIDVVVTYDVTGRAPRSDNPSRVNRAYASFTAFGVGDDGLATVRVRVPQGFEVETFGNDTKVTREEGYTVYAATDIPDPDQFDLFVSARNDAALDTTDVTTADGDRFVVRSWPNDPEWTEFVSASIRDGVPALAALIGRPWPIDDPVELRQAYTPYLYGYAGWFSAADDEIEIGEDLDRDVVLHELGHAWFNSTWFTGRWINEGLAQAYAARAAESLGGDLVAPVAMTPSDPVLFPLEEWGNPDFVEGADEAEGYGYRVSWWIVDQLVTELGLDTMRSVIAAAADRSIAYTGDGPAETDPRYRADWRVFLDLAEEMGGSKVATDLFRTYVVRADDVALLDDRAGARAAYHALADDGGEWAPPLAVRDRMATWQFDAAGELIDAAEAVLTARDRLVATSAELGVAVPARLEQEYESADRDLGAADAAVSAQLDAAERLLAAVRAEQADDGVFARLGLAGTDLQRLLDEGRTALAAGDTALAVTRAAQVTRALERAPDVGKQRALLGVGAVLLVVLLAGSIVALRRRRRALVSPNPPAIAEFQPDTVENSAIVVWGEAAEPGEPDHRPDDAPDG